MMSNQELKSECQSSPAVRASCGGSFDGARDKEELGGFLGRLDFLHCSPSASPGLPPKSERGCLTHPPPIHSCGGSFDGARDKEELEKDMHQDESEYTKEKCQKTLAFLRDASSVVGSGLGAYFRRFSESLSEEADVRLEQSAFSWFKACPFCRADRKSLTFHSHLEPEKHGKRCRTRFGQNENEKDKKFVYGPGACVGANALVFHCLNCKKTSKIRLPKPGKARSFSTGKKKIGVIEKSKIISDPQKRMQKAARLRGLLAEAAKQKLEKFKSKPRLNDFFDFLQILVRGVVWGFKNMPIVPLKPAVDKSTVRCQKCLEFGHWTYECKGKRKYVHRASRSTLLKKRLREIEHASSIENGQKNEGDPAKLSEKLKIREKTEDDNHGTSSDSSSSDSSDSDSSSSDSSESDSSDSSSSDSGSSSSSDGECSDADLEALKSMLEQAQAQTKNLKKRKKKKSDKPAQKEISDSD
ncbi:unnamed protein product [Notodromas monacha]|uniref:Uncharacterized protein n=1 Tax=Notodromas monacha TaxID=399045 RepID=A0A7R9BJ42_9CRUS|nr:unnamed protein product [Notodromas monacha]CAG0915582.1 unnamed protein product [Notodromas monacha]